MGKRISTSSVGVFMDAHASIASTPATPAAAPQHQASAPTDNTTDTTEAPAKVKRINQTIQFEPEFLREVKMYVVAHNAPEDKLTLRELVMRSLREYMAAH